MTARQKIYAAVYGLCGCTAAYADKVKNLGKTLSKTFTSFLS
jgi:hypothetical protein